MSRARSVVTRVVGEPHGGRFASLEGYRAVAALLVVVFHVRGELTVRAAGVDADPVDNFGNFGVAIFFVLSGFLLFRPTSRALFTGEREDGTGGFLLRRALRIYPAYWLALTGWALLATDQARLAADPISSFFLLSSSLTGLGVAWTLAIELRFYIFLAVLRVVLPMMAKRCSSAAAVLRLQLGLLAAMYVTSVVFRAYIVARPDGRALMNGSLFNHLDWFAVGMLLAIAVSWRDAGHRVPSALQGLADREWASFVCAAMCFGAVVAVMPAPMSLAFNEPPLVYFFRFALQGPAAGFLLLPAVLGRSDQLVQRTLRRPWPAAIGTLSYGLYLWHKSILGWIADRLHSEVSVLGLAGCFAAVLVVSLLIATLSYRLLERPALALARPRSDAR